MEKVLSGSAISKVFSASAPKMPGYRDSFYLGNGEVFSQTAPPLPSEWPMQVGNNIHVSMKSLIAGEELSRKAVACASALGVLALVFREEVSREEPNQRMADRIFEAMSKAIRHI